ncbi:DegT/DnrJ/EryC1/StrS family aminotransferase [Halorientalis litorea]|jgi:perosamine synthetase|uniref:DegT/DnrJ/EryC1/StrS family aminotransferase n=1 Tax=Halorientalis litorea TaxID=2931977 RepID=UPI001FF271B3|nr:DegT/DnrJ/EryC1/StrS family aminotransferase [Halorientalis litorea]
MSQGKIPIADVELTDEEIAAAVEVLESGYLVFGPNGEEFEERFADHVGADHAIAVSSGTAALHIVYHAMLEADDEVLVPSFSHISTASMLPMVGCTPVFCDVDPDTYTIDVEDARERITPDTEAIVPVHLYGNACDVDGVVELAREHDLKIVWDAAQAHGTEYDGVDIGSIPDAVTYSFYPTKNMFTGEGGMITTSDPDLAEQCRLLRAHWQTDKYYHPDLGFNYRMSDMEAAIGLEQLKKLDDMVDQRRENAAYLTDHLSDVDGVKTPRVEPEVNHSYHLYTVALDPAAFDIGRDAFIDELDERGVGASVHYPRPLHEQPAFRDRLGEKELPVAEEMADRVLSIPVYPGLDTDELATVADAVADVAAEHRV